MGDYEKRPVASDEAHCSDCWESPCSCPVIPEHCVYHPGNDATCSRGTRTCSIDHEKAQS